MLHSFFGDCVFWLFQFKRGVLPHKSVRAAFNYIFYKRIVWCCGGSQKVCCVLKNASMRLSFKWCHQQHHGIPQHHGTTSVEMFINQWDNMYHVQHHGTELYWRFEKEFPAQNVRTSVIYGLMVPSFFCYSHMGLPLIFPWMLHFRLTCQHFFLLFVIALSLVPCLSMQDGAGRGQGRWGRGNAPQSRWLPASAWAWKNWSERLGPAALVLRSIKRRKVLMNLLLKYRCLGENVLAETLPDPPRVHPRENGRQQYRRRVRLFDSWPEMSILTQMSTLALLALIQCHVFQQGVSWSLLNLMARQILMACRMARERRGAGSSLVSMETPYYKTIY